MISNRLPGRDQVGYGEHQVRVACSCRDERLLGVLERRQPHQDRYVHRMSWWVWEIDDRRESVLAVLRRDGNRAIDDNRVGFGEAVALRHAALPASVPGKPTVTTAEALKRRTGPFKGRYPDTNGWLRRCPSCGVVPEITRGELYTLADEAEANGQRTVRV